MTTNIAAARPQSLYHFIHFIFALVAIVIVVNVSSIAGQPYSRYK